MGIAVRSTTRIIPFLLPAILAVPWAALPARAVLVHAVNSVSNRPHNGGSPTQCDTGFVIQLPGGTVAECSLRAAIESTNAVAGHDFIVFHPDIFINASGFVALRPNSALPPIVDALSATIQGCHAGVRYNFLARANGGQGITVIGNSNTIGQAFSSSSGWTGVRNVASANGDSGMVIVGDGNLVAGNRAGTDPTGTSAMANAGFGISVNGTGNQIGGLGTLSDGTEVASGNLISGNTASGLFISPTH